MKTGILIVAMAVVIGGAGTVGAEPLASHPSTAKTSANGWNIQMGKFGETLVRESERAKGNRVFNLNCGEHGIDGLVRTTGPDRQVAYRVIEVKTAHEGTTFQLKETRAGRQLSAKWIEDRLVKAASSHPEAEARKAAREALQHFRKDPVSVRAELHGVSVGDNRYVVKTVDPSHRSLQGRNREQQGHRSAGGTSPESRE
jgi:hypothetical protein